MTTSWNYRYGMDTFEWRNSRISTSHDFKRHSKILIAYIECNEKEIKTSMYSLCVWKLLGRIHRNHNGISAIEIHLPSGYFACFWFTCVRVSPLVLGIDYCLVIVTMTNQNIVPGAVAVMRWWKAILLANIFNFFFNLPFLFCDFHGCLI